MTAVMPGPSSQDRAPTARIASLDQFRGYTVAGMLLVNFLSNFAAVPAILKHHNTYCSYADTIMPQFFLAVGFAYRLTYLRRAETLGRSAARWHAVWRNLALLIVGVVFYGLDGRVESWSQLQEMGWRGFFQAAFQRSPFQTLVHIAITSFWVLPVIGRSVGARLLFAAGSAVLHVVLSWWFYLGFAWSRPVIDGGPLGFLTWTTPLLAGSIAYDLIAVRGPRRSLGPLVLAALALMLAGYGLSCLDFRGLAPAPFTAPGAGHVVGLWTMSQRTGSATYLLFATGFGLAVLAVFVVASDLGGLRVGLFRTFGTNALAAYLLHPMVAEFVRPYAPQDAPGWYVAAAFGLFFAINWLFIRHIEREGVFLKL
jgi:predicted acyltransferase